MRVLIAEFEAWSYPLPGPVRLGWPGRFATDNPNQRLAARYAVLEYEGQNIMKLLFQDLPCSTKSIH